MTISDFALIALGVLFNMLTFALGCSVGVTIAKRKDSHHEPDRYPYEAEGFQYYDHASKN